MKRAPRAVPSVLTLVTILPAIAAAAPHASGTDRRPGPGPGTWTIVPEADSVRIPFELFRDEIRLVGSVNGQEVRMLVDNGALWDELLFFGSPRVDALRLEPDGDAAVLGAGAGDAVHAELASGIDLRLPGEDGHVIEFRDQTAIIMPYDPARPNPWEGSEGQVSSALFKHFVVSFDFDEGVMTLIRPEKFDPRRRGTEVRIQPLEGSGSWTLPAVVTLADGRRLELDVTMDLGWDEPLAINTGGPHAIALPENLTSTVLGVGAQGEIHGYLGTVRSVEIAAHRFTDVPTTYSTVEDGGSKAGEVMVGLGILARFHVTFDYPRHRLFLDPGRTFREPFTR